MVHDSGMTLLRSTEEMLSLMMERMVISMAFTVGEEQTALRKVTVWWEEARAQWGGRDSERLPRKAAGERWAVKGIPRPPDRGDMFSWGPK